MKNQRVKATVSPCVISTRVDIAKKYSLLIGCAIPYLLCPLSNTLAPLPFNITVSLNFLPFLPTLEKTYLLSRPPASYGVSYLFIQFNYYTILSSVHTSV